MCNAYEQHIRWTAYIQMMQALELGIPTNQSEADLPQVDDIRINDMGPAMRAVGNLIELVQMNFSLPPSGKGGQRACQRHSDFSSLRSPRFLSVAVKIVTRHCNPAVRRID
ncbi:hypothetical protein [Microvirga terricola]|uniref:hypothetical protein n=1 Tax=Microvirga terricola TaxID=2719797 RepID=UPI00197C2698